MLAKVEVNAAVVSEGVKTGSPVITTVHGICSSVMTSSASTDGISGSSEGREGTVLSSFTSEAMINDRERCVVNETK